MDDQVAALGDRGVIEVSGPEARAFLQRLITNDVEHLEPGQARYAALLTPQGKITADFLVVAGATEDQGFLLDVPEQLTADLAKRLSLYRLRAKVGVSDQSATLGVLAFAPGMDVPEGTLAYEDPRAPTLWRRGIAPRSTMTELGSDAARRACREARIRAGVPEGGLDFTYGEAFPHEANLDRLHGVDFRKGCYVGQEVVSRVQHRGTARKRVVGLAFEGEAPPVGADITVGDLSIGTMGSAVDGLGLGLIRLDKAEDARHADQPILAGMTPVRLEGPGWA